jgi:hypothetical protein
VLAHYLTRNHCAELDSNTKLMFYLRPAGCDQHSSSCPSASLTMAITARQHLLTCWTPSIQQEEFASAMKQLDQAIAIAAKQAKKAPQVLADTASEAAAKV